MFGFILQLTTWQYINNIQEIYDVNTILILNYYFTNVQSVMTRKPI